jgi:hypothetical protein
MSKNKRYLLSGVSGVVKSKMIGNNTVRYETIDGREVIRFHATDIIIKMPDGSTVVGHNGWTTVTTKDRFNKSLPNNWKVQSYGGKWYLTKGWKDYPRYRFRGEVVIDKYGEISEELAEYEDIAHTIGLYVKRYVRDLHERRVPALQLDDCCWDCLMVGMSEKLDSMDYMEHIRKHEWSSRRDAVILTRAMNYSPVSEKARKWVLDLWEGKRDEGDRVGKRARAEIRKSILAYLSMLCIPPMPLFPKTILMKRRDER